MAAQLELRTPNGSFDLQNSRLNVRLERQAVTFDNLNTRSGDRSYTLQIPVTPHNDALLGFPGHANRLDRYRTKFYPSVELLADGDTVMVGTFRLDSVGPKYFKGTLYAGVSSIAQITDGSLQDIDMGTIDYEGPIVYPANKLPNSVTIPNTWAPTGADPIWETSQMWFPLLVGGPFYRKDTDATRSDLFGGGYNVQSGSSLYAGQTVNSKLPKTADDGTYWLVANGTDTTDIDNNNAGGGSKEGRMAASWSVPRIFKRVDGRWEDIGPWHNVLGAMSFKPTVFLRQALEGLGKSIGVQFQGALLEDKTFRRIGIMAPDVEANLNWRHLGKCKVQAGNRNGGARGNVATRSVKFSKSIEWPGPQYHQSQPDHLYFGIFPQRFGRTIWATTNTDYDFAPRPHMIIDGGTDAFWTDGVNPGEYAADFQDSGVSSNFDDNNGCFFNDSTDRKQYQRYAAVRSILNTVVYDNAQAFTHWKAPSDFPASNDGEKTEVIGYRDPGVGNCVYGGNGDGVGSEWRCPQDGEYTLTYHVALTNMHIEYYHSDYSGNSLAQLDQTLMSMTSVVLTLNNDDQDLGDLADYWIRQRTDPNALLYSDKILAYQRVIGDLNLNGNPIPLSTSGTGNANYTLTANHGSIGAPCEVRSNNMKDYFFWNNRIVTVEVTGKFAKGDLVTPYIMSPFERCVASTEADRNGDNPWNKASTYFASSRLQQVEFALGSYDDNYFMATPNFGDEQLQVGKMLPDIKQKDFLKQILVAFNQYLYLDPDTNTATLVPRKDFFKTFGEAVDITNQIDQDTVEFTPNGGPSTLSLGFKQWDDDVTVQKQDTLPSIDIEEGNLYAGAAQSITLDFYRTGDATFRLQMNAPRKVRFPFAASPDAMATPSDENPQWPTQPGNRLILAGQMTDDGIKTIGVLNAGIGGDQILYNGPYDANGYRYPMAEGVNSDATGWQPNSDLLDIFWTDYQLFAGLEQLTVQAYLTPLQWNQMGANSQVKVNNETYVVQTIQGYDPTGQEPATLTLLRL